jgi:hypothetical protein
MLLKRLDPDTPLKIEKLVGGAATVEAADVTPGWDVVGAPSWLCSGTVLCSSVTLLFNNEEVEETEVALGIDPCEWETANCFVDVDVGVLPPIIMPPNFFMMNEEYDLSSCWRIFCAKSTPDCKRIKPRSVYSPVMEREPT